MIDIDGNIEDITGMIDMNILVELNIETSGLTDFEQQWFKEDLEVIVEDQTQYFIDMLHVRRNRISNKKINRLVEFCNTPCSKYKV